MMSLLKQAKMRMFLKAASCQVRSVQWPHRQTTSEFEETSKKLLSQAKYNEATKFVLKYPEIGRMPELFATYKPFDKNLASVIYGKARLATKGASAFGKRREYSTIPDSGEKYGEWPEFVRLCERIFKSKPVVDSPPGTVPDSREKDELEFVRLCEKLFKSEPVVDSPPGTVDISGCPGIVLWHIESCKLPRNYRGEDACKMIWVALRERLGVRGPFNHYRVYGDAFKISDKVIQGCSDSAWPFMHAPGEVAVRRIIREMLDFTRLHQPPAVITLISGDERFADTLDFLNNWGYSVISILPDELVQDFKRFSKHTLYFGDVLSGKVKPMTKAKNKDRMSNRARVSVLKADHGKQESGDN